MILDRVLNWKEHITILKGETLRALNILRIISRINFGSDRKTLLILNWAIGKSMIDYGFANILLCHTGSSEGIRSGTK